MDYMDYSSWGTRELIEQINYLESKLDKTCNGWSNYETWRVQLEIMDGYEWEDTEPMELGELADYIKDYVEECVLSESGKTSLATDYAQAFLNEVNYTEIAQHVLENNSHLVK